MQVSLFVTCLTDLFSPQVGMATVRVLEHFGCGVDFPEGQTCCGQPQFNNGYHTGARTLAERMIRVFEKSTVVVTPSASCCAMIREHYPVLFKDDAKWEAEAQGLAAKTYELVEFLTKVLKVDLSGLSLPERTKVACHYTCHNRGLHQGPEVYQRVVGAMGAEVVPLEKGEQCCGFGGTFAVKYPEISGPLALDKVACAERSGAEVLLVNDAGCAMNIAGAAQRQGNEKFKTKHIAELMAAAIASGGKR